jgi:hypothetical protein
MYIKYVIILDHHGIYVGYVIIHDLTKSMYIEYVIILDNL